MKVAQSVSCRKATGNGRKVISNSVGHSCAQVLHKAVARIGCKQEGHRPPPGIESKRRSTPQPQRAQRLASHAPLKPRGKRDAEEEVASHAQMKNDSQRDPSRYCKGNLKRPTRLACYVNSLDACFGNRLDNCGQGSSGIGGRWQGATPADNRIVSWVLAGTQVQKRGMKRTNPKWEL